MKLSIKKIVNTKIIKFIRNNLNIFPIYFDLKEIECSSVSDAFLWRTDNNFETKFSYIDILNLFYKIPNANVEINFFSRENKLLKKKKIDKIDLSNELIINKEFLNGLESYGSFYIHHFTKRPIAKETILSSRCYLGYSKNKNLFSFVHGNTLTKIKDITTKTTIEKNIVKSSILKLDYNIQKSFDNFENNELFFSNPTSKTIKLSFDGENYNLKARNVLKISIKNRNLINFASNCYFLRPMVFSYKNSYMDVHHS